MANVPVHEWTLLEAARRVREGEVSSRELTGALLGRIASLNPEVNACITVLRSARWRRRRRATKNGRGGCSAARCTAYPSV